MMTQADILRRRADELGTFLRSLPDESDAAMPGWQAVTAMRDAATSLESQQRSLDAWAAAAVQRVGRAIGGTVGSFSDDGQVEP